MLDVGETTIEGWVARGQFPAPKRVGPNAMRRWSWVEVQRHIEGPEDDAATDLIGRIKNATKRETSRSQRSVRDGHQDVHALGQVSQFKAGNA
jgi:hypothetical protein